LTDLQQQIVELVKNWSDDVLSKLEPALTLFYKKEVEELDEDQLQHNNQNAEDEEMGGEAEDYAHNNQDEEDEENQPPPTPPRRSVRVKKIKDDKEFVEDDPDRARSRRVVKDLRHASEDLHESYDDPLPEAIDAANQATKKHKKTELILIRHSDKRNQDRTGIVGRRGERMIQSPRQKASAASTPVRTSKAKKSQAELSDEEEPGPAAKKLRRQHSNNRKSKGNNLYANKQSARRESWDGSDEEEQLQSVQLSAIPAGSRAGVPQKKRRFFSAAEKQALREGITIHGVGQWKQILDDNIGVFRGRNAVNLKVTCCCYPNGIPFALFRFLLPDTMSFVSLLQDLYRTMMKNDEL
jgi:hypothetical protein